MSDTEGVRQLYDMPRQIPGPGVISGGQTQEEIDLQMTELGQAIPTGMPRHRGSEGGASSVWKESSRSRMI